MEETGIQDLLEAMRQGDDQVRALVLALITALEKKKIIERKEVFNEYDKILSKRVSENKDFIEPVSPQ